MKKFALAAFILIVICGLALSSTKKVTGPTEPRTTWIQSTIRSIQVSIGTEPGQSNIGGNGTPGFENLNPQEVFKSANDLARKAILTEQERSDMNAILASKEHINAAVSDLRKFQVDGLAENQKQRMAAGLFLLNALSAPNNPANEYVREQIAELVLDPALERIDDLKLKRSVVADRVELFMTLKRDYPVDASEISSAASTELQKKMITFATSFVNLNKKGL